MHAPRRYRNTGDLPAVIPVFPLTGVLLLPKTRLPLNIFEPRYLAMIDSAIGSYRMIGMIQPKVPAKHRNYLPVFCSEQMWYQRCLVHNKKMPLQICKGIEFS